MKQKLELLGALSLFVGGALLGCADVGPAPAGETLAPSASAPADQSGQDAPTPPLSTEDESMPEAALPAEVARSVGDVTIEIVGRAFEPADFTADADSITARVLNESQITIDVTLRFIHRETTVHLAYLRVMPATMTTVSSPEPADEVRLSGVDERGQAIPVARFVKGRDFDELTPAVYRFSVSPVEEGPVETTPAEALPAPPPPEEPYSMPELSLIEPASDTTLAQGSTLRVRWNDASTRAGTVVIVGLRLAGIGGDKGLIQMAPAVGAALDGINDELLIVLEGIDDGLYEVVARIDDGVGHTIAIAPGMITVLRDEDNEAPTLTIISPLEAVELRAGEVLSVLWEDEDLDDNATVTFSLEASVQEDAPLARYVVSPPLSEDPDGGADSLHWAIQDVLPGVYDLVGMIDDGRLKGTDRVEGVVIVLPEPENDAPHLILLEPGEAIEVETDGLLTVRWSDADENDNALIALMLDPTRFGFDLDGDEVLLVSSLAEDQDGPADIITLGLPADIPLGRYRVAGLISDGLSQAVAFAPGVIEVVAPRLRIDLLPTIELIMPADDLVIRLGDSIVVQPVGTNIPEGAKMQFTLSNEADGGTLRVAVPDVGSEFDKAGSSFDLQVLLDTSDLPISNLVWPRTFHLEVEVDAGSLLVRDTAPGTICIRQDFEVVEAEVIGYLCPALPQPRPRDVQVLQKGLVVTWVPGGCLPEGLGIADFWLSADGQIPADGEEDAEHQLLLSREMIPDQTQQEFISYLAFDELLPGGYGVVVGLHPPDGGSPTLVTYDDTLVHICPER